MQAPARQIVDEPYAVSLLHVASLAHGMQACVVASQTLPPEHCADVRHSPGMHTLCSHSCCAAP